jgi:uncharacterized protein (TIGR00730 family)
MDEAIAVAVFCGSSMGNSPAYQRVARDMATAIADVGGRLIYGGSSVGLMGVLADGCLAAGAPVTGVIPDFLVEAEVAHRHLVDLRVVRSMSERKALMLELADVVVALPGGLGTLDELLDALTLKQLGVFPRPVGLLDEGGFFRPLLEVFARWRGEGFITAATADLLTVSGDAGALLAALCEQAQRSSARGTPYTAT